MALQYYDRLIRPKYFGNNRNPILGILLFNISWNLQSLTRKNSELLKYHSPTHSYGECICFDLFAFYKLDCSSLGRGKLWVRLRSTSLLYSTGTFCKWLRWSRKYAPCFGLLNTSYHIYSVGKYCTLRRGPAQDVPFFYTPSNLSALQSCKSIISTDFTFIFMFK